MPTRNVYVKPADLQVWEQAETAATDQDRSLSDLVADALRHYLRQPVRVLTDVDLMYVNIGSDGRASTVIRDNETGRIIEIPGGEVRRIPSS